MHSSISCATCEGRGKCPSCDGTGTNPHLHSPEPKCPHCSGTGMCSECDGAGKNAMAMPRYHGSLLTQGLLWAVIVIGIFWATSLIRNSRLHGLAVILIWTVSWCLILYRNAKRHERRHNQLEVLIHAKSPSSTGIVPMHVHGQNGRAASK